MILPLRLAAASLAILLIAGYARAAVIVSTPANFASALAGAVCGDTLAAGPGTYGDIQVRKVCPAGAPLTITSADPANPAVFRSILVTASAAITLDHLAVTYTPDLKTVDWSAAVTISSSSNIALTNSKITGGPAIAGGLETDTVRAPSDCVIGRPCGYGVNVQHASAVTISGDEISQFGRGISLGYLTDGLLRANSVHDTRRTPVVGAGLLRVAIDANHLASVHPWAWGQPYGDHADFLALWIDGAQPFDSAGILITGNLMEQGTGTATTGTWLQNGPTHTFAAPAYTRNVILNGNSQGITVRGVLGPTITGNVLLQTSGDLKAAPSVLLTLTTSGAEVSGNVAWQVADMTAAKANHIGVNDYLTPGVQPPWVLDMARRLVSAP